MMYQYWLINCNKCTTLIPNVNNRGNYYYSFTYYRCRGRNEGHIGNSVLFTPFFCKPKTAPKKSIFKKKQKEKKLNLLAFISSTISASQIITQFPCTNCIYILSFPGFSLCCFKYQKGLWSMLAHGSIWPLFFFFFSFGLLTLGLTWGICVP